VAWLCGRTGIASTCSIEHRAGSVSMAAARPYDVIDAPTAGTAIGHAA
jgi:hypothetical protein